MAVGAWGHFLAALSSTDLGLQLAARRAFADLAVNSHQSEGAHIDAGVQSSCSYLCCTCIYWCDFDPWRYLMR